jgi:hypothetical protein
VAILAAIGTVLAGLIAFAVLAGTGHILLGVILGGVSLPLALGVGITLGDRY